MYKLHRGLHCAHRLAAATMLALTLCGAHAQSFSPGYGTYGAPMSNFINSTLLNNQALHKSAPSKERQRAPEPVIASAPAAAERNAQELVKHFPAQQRAQMAQAFQQSLDIYYQIEAKLGLPRGNLGGALAAFLIGNYAMHAGVEVSDAAFMAVVQQFRTQPALRAAFREQRGAALRDTYEQFAMVGTFMAIALKSQQQHSPEQIQNLRAAARANLKQVMGIDVARLRITERGASID